MTSPLRQPHSVADDLGGETMAAVERSKQLGASADCAASAEMLHSWIVKLTIPHERRRECEYVVEKGHQESWFR